MSRTLQNFGASGWLPDDLPSLSGKSYVITGGNSGIGFEAAAILLKQGAKVLLLCRSHDRARAAVEKLEKQVAGAQVQFVLADLASLESVRRGAEQVSSLCPEIDALICNAGIMAIPDRTLTEDGFETQFAVNHLAHFLLSGLLFPNIVKASGRMVNVSSKAHAFKPRRIRFEDVNFSSDYSPWEAYAQSKLANLLFTRELNRRLQLAGQSIFSSSCHPGWAATNLQTTGPAGFFSRLMTFGNRFIAQSAAQGSWPIVLCSVDPAAKRNAYYGPTKWSGLLGPIQECEVASHAENDEAANSLWELSEEMTGLNWQI